MRGVSVIMGPFSTMPAALVLLQRDSPGMRNVHARAIGEELKTLLARLRALAKEERAARGPDAEAIEIAVVNLDSAMEILTE